MDRILEHVYCNLKARDGNLGEFPSKYVVLESNRLLLDFQIYLEHIREV